MKYNTILLLGLSLNFISAVYLHNDASLVETAQLEEICEATSQFKSLNEMQTPLTEIA